MFKRKKKKTGCETPEFRSKVPMPPVRPAKPNPDLGWQPTKSLGTKPPKPPTSGSNARKTSTLVPPQYTTPPMPPVKPPKQKNVEDFHRVNLYLTVEDLNNYIHNALNGEGKYALNTYVPIGATVNNQNLNIEIDCVAINPKDSDYGRRIRLEVKL